MSIRVGLRPMARPALAVPVRCGARGDMKALVMGWLGSGNKPGGWNAVDIMELLGFTVDTIAITDTIPDLCPYSLLWIGPPHGRGSFSAAELAAIKAFVEDQGASLIIQADTDVWYTLVPINGLAGIWGCAYSTLLNYYYIRPTAGQGAHPLWVTPTKGIGLQYATRYDTQISTIGAGFTQYADLVTKIAIYREFPSGGRVVMGLHDGLLDHDGWLVNLIKWIDGAKAEAFADDFEDLDDWTLTEYAKHDVTLVDDTWVRFKPIAGTEYVWSPYSTLIHTLANPISGDFLFAFNFRYYQPSNFPLSRIIVQLLDADDNVVAHLGLSDAWTAGSGGVLSQFCDTSQFSGKYTAPLSGHFRMSISRSGDTVYLCSGFCIGGDSFLGTGPYYDYGTCTRTVAKIKIMYTHNEAYWTATEYYDVDHVILWS